MAKALNNKYNEKDYTFYYFLLPILFLITFFLSYIFSSNYIVRAEAVSIDEEYTESISILNENDLNSLYKDYSEGSRVIILSYHQIREYRDTDSRKTRLFVTSPEIFDKEMKYLIDNNYKVISMPEYIEHLNNNTLYLLSENIVIITFDDGYKSQYEKAFPILKKYNLSATFFVYADCVDKYPICMSSQDLLELSSSNMYIANHTLHHIFLPDYKDNIVRREIIENQKALDQILYPNKSIKVLAYPLGGVDYRIKNILIDIDYSAGFGVLTNVSGLSRDKYNLKRYLLGNDFELFKSIFTQK